MQSKVKVSLKKEHVWDLYDKIIFAKVIVYTSWFFLFFFVLIFFVFCIFDILETCIFDTLEILETNTI